MRQATPADLTNNWADWLRFTAEHVPGGASETFGTIRCASVGLPVPMLNQAFVDEATTADDVAAATQWMNARNIPFFLTVAESAVEDVAEAAAQNGLDRTDIVVPGMAFDPLSTTPTGVNGDLEVRTVIDAEALGDAAVVIADAYAAPLVGAQLIVPATMLDDARCEWFVSYIHGEPAACGQLFRTAETAGVYNIGVTERYRQRGLGGAITAAVLDAGRAAGCTTAVLQASAQGEPVYRRMGFATVARYHRFVPADGARAI